MTSIQFLSTTPSELKKEIVNELINSLLPKLSKEFQPKTPTEFLSRTEVAKLLKVDISTIHNWTKKGKIISYGIGGRVLYKRSEILSAIVKLNH
jgi:excisionase family DNA binding protein